MGVFENSGSDRFEYVGVEHLQMKESARSFSRSPKLLTLSDLKCCYIFIDR